MGKTICIGIVRKPLTETTARQVKRVLTSKVFPTACVLLLTFATLAVLLSGFVHAENSTGDLVAWMPYDQALAKAKKENKHVLVNFTTSWCGWCKKMKATTYSDPTVVQTIGTKFVAAKVDGDSYNVLKLTEGDITEKGLTVQYGVRGYPATWFLEPDGKRIAPANGYIDVTSMQYILDYVGSNFNDDMAFSDYVTQQKKLESIRPSTKIKLGMTTAQVKSSWGAPTKIETKTDASGASEEWQYSGNQYLTFKKGTLRNYQERAATASSPKEKASSP